MNACFYFIFHGYNDVDSRRMSVVWAPGIFVDMESHET